MPRSFRALTQPLGRGGPGLKTGAMYVQQNGESSDPFPGAESKGEYRILGSKEYPEWSVEVTIRVVGLERVTVPAGTFDTFRVEVSSRYRQKRTDGRSGSGTFKNVDWYAPEVKREVLRDYEYNRWDGVIDSRRRFVLVDYTVR
jgi:hypothetical protein